jgi:hypothetical protein
MHATFVAWRGDTLLLRDLYDRGGEVHRIPASIIERLEVGHRRSRGAGAVRGLWIGFLTGALLGGTLGYVGGSEEGEFNKAQEGAVLAAVGAGAGLVLGPIIGVAFPGYRWTKVELPTRVGIVPLSNNSLGLTISLQYSTTP